MITAWFPVVCNTSLPSRSPMSRRSMWRLRVRKPSGGSRRVPMIYISSMSNFPICRESTSWIASENLTPKHDSSSIRCTMNCGTIGAWRLRRSMVLCSNHLTRTKSLRRSARCCRASISFANAPSKCTRRARNAGADRGRICRNASCSFCSILRADSTLPRLPRNCVFRSTRWKPTAAI